MHCYTAEDADLQQILEAEMSIFKIPISKAEIGMYVSELTPGLRESGMNSRGLMSRRETIEKLVNAGIQELYIDTSKGRGSEFARPVNGAQASELKPQKPLAEERENASSIYRQARNLVGNLMRDAKLGKPIDIGPVEDLAAEINDSVLSNANALLCLSQIREKDSYLLEHSINVGILMGVFSRYLGYDMEARQQLVTGALLHDVGKIRVPLQVLNKPGKLTEEEWVAMRMHVTWGEEILQISEGITETAMSICAQHHEKIGGGGYPRNLTGEQISVAGRMASVVDIYDAISADRVYHVGRTPLETVRIMTDMAGPALDKPLVYQFVRCMSLYPVGALVELSSGRLGVVVQVYADKPDTPLVRTFYNKKLKAYEAPKLVDLSNGLLDLKIKGIVDPRALGIRIQDFI